MSDCIFCKIVKGELPTNKVLETDDILVIRDINPKAPVHDLVVPKKHLESLNDAKEEDKEILGEMVLTAVKAAKKEGIYDKGYRLIINTGKNGGQLVPHLHMHLLGGKNLGPKIIFE